jgi:hypothetical protein
MPKAKNRSETGVARVQRRGRAQGVSAAAPIHTERGKLGPGNQMVSQSRSESNKGPKNGGQFVKGHSVPGPGRPPGSKDKRPRAGTLRAVYEDLIEHGHGHAMMLTAVTKGIKATPAVAVKYLELGARVLDKTDDTGGKHVHFTLITNVDFEKLRGAQPTAGLPEANRG